MKRYIIPLSMAVMVLASCSIEEDQPFTSDGRHIALTGSSSTETKVSLGEKNGEKYPLLWFTGDAISINSKDATIDGAFVGELANLDSNSSGKASGNFLSVNELVPTSDMDLLILYPGTGMDYKTRTITGSVASSQTQRSANSSVHLGNNCFSFAEAAIKEGQTDGVSFILSHKTAFVKVVVTALDEEYQNYYLSGITLAAEGQKLAGDLSYSVDTEEMSYTNTSSSVGATISTPSILGAEGQSVYFTALPCTLTNTEVTVTISMQDSAGQNFTFPVTINGSGDLKASCLTIINVTAGITEPWYNTMESRDLVGGWAYGDQNTYLIEQKSNEDTSIEIDVRAKGDFTKVKEPKYCGIICPANRRSNLIYLMNGANKITNVANADEQTNFVEIGDDYTITVYCNKGSIDSYSSYAHWGVVGIYDEDYNILWSYMIWQYYSGDEPGDVDYGDFKFMDRVIGAPFSNSKAVEYGTFDQPAAAYFQWGRKDPFVWNNDSPADMYKVAATAGNTSVETGIQNPTTAYGNGTKDSDWKGTDMSANLWGGNSTGSTSDLIGKKTIYDPCPKGYRVPDQYVLRTVETGVEQWQVDFSSNTNTSGIENQDPNDINEESPFYEASHAVAAYMLNDGTYDYWPYDGVVYGNGTNYKDRSAESAMTSYMYWSCNLSSGSPTLQAYMFGLIFYSSGPGQYSTTTYKNWRCTVRCQKE